MKLSAQKTLALLFLVCALPLLIAFLALKFEWFTTTNNYGTLLQPQVSVSTATFENINGEPFTMADVAGKWVLIQVIQSNCDTVCQNALYYQGQARKTKGKEMYRIERVVLVTDRGPLSTQLLRQHPEVRFIRAPLEQLQNWLPLDQGIVSHRGSQQVLTHYDHIFVADPLGHVMMRFPPNHQLEFKKFRKDISRLLWASNIG